MKPFLNRDEQIDLMETVEQRHDALFKKILSDDQARKVIATPRRGNADDSSYTMTEMRVARCG